MKRSDSMRFFRRFFLCFRGLQLRFSESPEGVILHTTLKISGAALEMSEADGIYQPMPGMFYFYVPDVDAAYRRALEAGASSISEPSDQSYGDRSAGVKDTFGNLWYFAKPVRG